MKGMYQVNQDWKKLASRIVKSQQLVLVIGGADTGKTTFCRFLADAALEEDLHVAFVDADIGQSQVGPPTTVGMKSFGAELTAVQFDTPADQFYFVGDLSPRGNTIEILTGTRLMVDSARETGADFIVVDTTGYIHDPPAVLLKQHKIELIRPSQLVCIGRSTELEQITACYSQREWVDIHYLLPHRSARSKSREARNRYRKSRFDTYFGMSRESGSAQEGGESSVQRLPFAQIRGGHTPFFIGRIANEKELEILTRLAETPVYHAEWGHRTLCLISGKRLSKATLAHIKNYLSLTRVTAEVRGYFDRRLVGLIDGTGKTYAIGAIESVDFEKRELSVRCAPDATKQARVLQFGDHRL